MSRTRYAAARHAWYFLGVDIGATKSHALIADRDRPGARGSARPGRATTRSSGTRACARCSREITGQALASADLRRADIAGAGFGVAGYDWPSERADTLAAIDTLGLTCPVEAVNDTLIGLLAGASQGWGVAVIARHEQQLLGLGRDANPHRARDRATGRCSPSTAAHPS